MKHAIFIRGENVQRVVRDIDYKILCDGKQYGLITHKKEEVVVCRPRNVQGEGFGYWTPEQTLQDASVDVDEIDDEGAKLWEQYQAENAWSGVCPCGVEGCRGLDWMLDGNEPY